MERQNVIHSILKLMRAMRRHPPRPDHGFPPAIGRFLTLLSENNGASSREMCELLDIRPSSLSELLVKMEREQLINRTADENDRRVSRITLSERGNEALSRISARRDDEAERLSACFTDEEAAQFCALCDRLSAHLESLPYEDGERFDGHPPFPHGPRPGGYPPRSMSAENGFPHRRGAYCGVSEFRPERPNPRPFRGCRDGKPASPDFRPPCDSEDCYPVNPDMPQTDDPRNIQHIHPDSIPPCASEEWQDDFHRPMAENQPLCRGSRRCYARGGVPPLPTDHVIQAHGRPTPSGSPGIPEKPSTKE